MSSRLGEAEERPIRVTGLGRSMGDVFEPLEMLGPEGVQAKINKNWSFSTPSKAKHQRTFHQHHILVFALARPWNGRPT